MGLSANNVMFSFFFFSVILSNSTRGNHPIVQEGARPYTGVGSQNSGGIGFRRK
jgi:hypothetical protein